MIDFIKISVKDILMIDYFKNHQLLEYLSNENKFNRHDPEVLNTKDKYQHKGIIFCFYPNELKISFLPHYYFNNNLHNANDFKVSDCINVINNFINVFDVDASTLKIINLEFGLNVVSPIAIKDLITFLAYHNQNEFRTDKDYQFSKKSFKTDYKVIKAYAKGLQFPDYTDINTFRFEIKSNQSKYFNPFNIFNLNDLLNVSVYETLINKLIEEFADVLILDDKTDLSNLKPKQQTELQKYQNPNYWYRIKQDNQRNKFNKEKVKYCNLLDKTGNHLKLQLQKIVFDKLQDLKTGAVSTPCQIIKTGAISTPYTNTETGAVSTIYNNGIGTNNKINTCKITGLDISMQKDSILLSHTGLRYYFENDKKVFEQIKKRYLTKVWYKSNFEIQIKELAHNIRTVRYNQNTKQVRIYPSGQNNFLSQFEFF